MEYVRSPFEPAEYEALTQLAERNIRPISSEVRHIVREELRRAGLLAPSEAHVQADEATP